MQERTKKPEPPTTNARPAAAPPRPEGPALPDSREVLRAARAEVLGLSLAERVF